MEYSIYILQKNTFVEQNCSKTKCIALVSLVTGTPLGKSLSDSSWHVSHSEDSLDRLSRNLMIKVNIMARFDSL